MTPCPRYVRKICSAKETRDVERCRATRCHAIAAACPLRLMPLFTPLADFQKACSIAFTS